VSDVEISGDLDGLDDVLRRFRNAPDVFGRYMRQFLQAAVIVVERAVKIFTPVNTGALRSSVGHEVKGAGAKMQGIVGSAKSYAAFVELDTKPHWPPYGPIEYWVMRKFGLKGSALYLVTRAVQRKIARVGTKGARMFQRGFEETKDKVGRLWSDTWANVIKKEL
jgi:hypothetical protein